MKRYRVLAVDFDSSANILKLEIDDKWDPQVKATWKKNKTLIIKHLISEFGVKSSSNKIKNFIELDILALSVIAFHNKFLHQARNAYVIGSYYPALTAVCALGERILNHLILTLRDDYKCTPEYKKICNKYSFDNWDIAINTLNIWKVILPEVVDLYKDLKEIRNDAIHFNPEVDTNDKELSLKAIHKIKEIIGRQFAAFGNQPWFIQGTPGVSFIKKEFEEVPFVKKIILPSCYRVGYLHTLDLGNRGWIVHDDFNYENREISDQEFADLFNNRG